MGSPNAYDANSRRPARNRLDDAQPVAVVAVAGRASAATEGSHAVFAGAGNIVRWRKRFHGQVPASVKSIADRLVPGVEAHARGWPAARCHRLVRPISIAVKGLSVLEQFPPRSRLDKIQQSATEKLGMQSATLVLRQQSMLEHFFN